MQRIRLTESDIHKIVRNVLNEIVERNQTTPRFKEATNAYGDITISAYDDNKLMGYIIIVIHEHMEDLDSEISETDSYNTAMAVVRKLDYNKPTIELADVDVRKEYRRMGVSKMLLEYVLNKYGGYQFYLRVCPTDGVDEQTLAHSVMKYGFTKIDSTENGTFLIKR